MSAASSFSRWLVVRKRRRCEVDEATPSSALSRPENVTLLLNLRAREERISVSP